MRIAVIPGDGIGPEVTAQAVALLRAIDASTHLDIEIVEWDLGADRYLETGSAITEDEFAELSSAYDGIFLGALGDPRVSDQAHAREILLGLRFRLDLYINLRPVRLYDPRLSPLRGVRSEDINLVVFRENTEGVYVGMGGHLKAGTPDEVAIETDINTYKGVERIVRAAFAFAAERGRRKVTLTDKANAMPHAGRLWRNVFRVVAHDYPDIEKEAVYADALALDLIRRPARYDVIVAPNLFGDLLSDLTAALVGGLGLAPSASLHPGRPGLFEPVHGSAPDIAGTGAANPMAAMLTVGLMLEYLGEGAVASAIEDAVAQAVSQGRVTPDLGGEMNTEAVAESVISEVMRALPS